MVRHVLMKPTVFIQVAPSFVTGEVKSRWSNEAICPAREEYRRLVKETDGKLCSLGSFWGSLSKADRQSGIKLQRWLETKKCLLEPLSCTTHGRPDTE